MKLHGWKFFLPVHWTDAALPPIDANAVAGALSGICGEGFARTFLTRPGAAQILLASRHVHDRVDHEVTFAENGIVEDFEAWIRLWWQRQAVRLVVNVALVLPLVQRQFRLVGEPAQSELFGRTCVLRQIGRSGICHHVILGISVAVSTQSFHLVSVLHARNFNL